MSPLAIPFNGPCAGGAAIPEGDGRTTAAACCARATRRVEQLPAGLEPPLLAT